MVRKPSARIIGGDANVFVIVGEVSQALKQAGRPDLAKIFIARAFLAHSYDEVLALVQEYVEPVGVDDPDEPSDEALEHAGCDETCRCGGDR